MSEELRGTSRDTDIANAKTTVLVFDTTLAHRPVLLSALGRCSARADWFGDTTTEGLRPTPQRMMALVEVPALLQSDDLSLRTIRALRQQGFTIIGYCHGGGDRWSIASRCQVLVAGAAHLLDASHDDFVAELEAQLRRLIAEERRGIEEEQRVRGAFAALGLIGESDALLRVFRLVLRVSPLSDLATLISGETGTGKELVARAIHQLDLKRCTRPIISVNCAAVSSGVAESELFGHRRGAFTGADRDRLGLIRAAEGGVLFLDEIGELDDGLQGKLLRVLQEGRLFAVGDEREVKVDFRIIAATNRNLEEMVQQGRFRADLLHRINVVSVHIPALRERPEDVRPLIHHFLDKHRSLADKYQPSATQEFVQAVSELELPGNAREVENIVRRCLMAKEDATALTLSDLPLSYLAQLAGTRGIARAAEESAATAASGQPEPRSSSRPSDRTDAVSILEANDWNLARALNACEQLFVRAALHQSQGNSSQTARLLGITARSVYNKVRKHGLVR